MPLPLVPIIGSAFAGFSIASVKYLLPFIIWSAIKFLGITLVTFTIADTVTDQFGTYLLGYFNNLPADIISMLIKIGFLDFINIMIAGWAAQVTLRSTLGSFNKMKITPSV